MWCSQGIVCNTSTSPGLLLMDATAENSAGGAVVLKMGRKARPCSRHTHFFASGMWAVAASFGRGRSGGNHGAHPSQQIRSDVTFFVALLVLQG